MTTISASLLVTSGFLVLLVGFLCGAPLGRAINKGDSDEHIRAWRVAHSSLVGGGVMLLAIAPNLASIALPGPVKAGAAIMLCVSVWSFSFALTFGAAKGHRGTAPAQGAWAKAIYAANMIGVILSTISIFLLTLGAGIHLLRAFALA